MNLNRLLMAAGIGVWLIVPWFFTFNPAEPQIFRWGLCILREGSDCVRSIYWLDFTLLGAGLLGFGWWRQRRQG